MSRILTGPVRELVTGVQAVISGDYTKRVAVSGRDEIAELAAAFNQMTSSLEHMQELEAELRRQDRFSARRCCRSIPRTCRSSRRPDRKSVVMGKRVKYG